MEQKPGYIKYYTNTVSKLSTAGESFDGLVLEFCSISFKNIGTVDATVNGMPLLAGDPMRTFENELPHGDNTSYSLQFNTGVGTRQVIVDYKKVVNAVFIETKVKPLKCSDKKK